MLSLHPQSLVTEINIPNGKLYLHHPVLEDSGCAYSVLQQGLAWRQDRIQVHGRQVNIPRLQAWYGEPHCRYTYSGLTMQPIPMPAPLMALKSIAEQITGSFFNAVLCNLYRDGQDSVGWHADNEPELGKNPVIASYSFGAERRFLIKPKKGKQPAQALKLCDNSLLVMGGEMQHHWNHQLPKTKQSVGPRINLTFRFIHPE